MILEHFHFCHFLIRRIAPAFMFYLKEQGKKARESAFQSESWGDGIAFGNFSAGSERLAQFNYQSNFLGIPLDPSISTFSYKIAFHARNEIPSMLKGYFYMEFDESKQFQIDPLVIQSSDNLRAYQPKYRKCFFENERQLRFFRNYTETNCRVECLSNLMKSECECVKFYLPRKFHALKLAVLGIYRCCNRRQCHEDLWNWQKRMHKSSHCIFRRKPSLRIS